MRFVWILIAFVAAALAAGLAGTAISTQFVIAGLTSVGAEVPLGERLSMTLFDLTGMGPIYTIVMAIGLAIGFVVAALLLLVLPVPRLVGYVLAGIAVMATILFAIQANFWGTMPIAGARTTAGYIMQLMAGGLGGLVFHALLPRPKQA